MNATEIKGLTNNELVDLIADKIITARAKLKWWQRLFFDAILTEFLGLILELKLRLELQQRERFNEHEQII